MAEPTDTAAFVIGEVRKRLMQKGKMSKEIMSLIYEIQDRRRPTLKALTRNQMDDACYELRLDITLIKEKHDCMIESMGITSAEAQRFALIDALNNCANMKNTTDAILLSPEFLFFVADKGRRRKQRDDEEAQRFPNSGEWIAETGIANE